MIYFFAGFRICFTMWSACSDPSVVRFLLFLGIVAVSLFASFGLFVIRLRRDSSMLTVCLFIIRLVDPCWMSSSFLGFQEHAHVWPSHFFRHVFKIYIYIYMFVSTSSSFMVPLLLISCSFQFTFGRWVQLVNNPAWRYCRVSRQCIVVVFIYYRQICRHRKALTVTLRVEYISGVVFVMTL